MSKIIRKIERGLAKRMVDILPDRFYVKLLFHGRVGYWPNLTRPRTYNEKLQWLKFNDIHPEYTSLVDKVDAKQYVAEVVGNKYIIPTIGIWDAVDSIDWASLPNQFVIKCTGDSGGIVICKDKSTLDIEKAKQKLSKGWGSNYYKLYKEYPYKDVKPRVIAEEYMEDESGYELKDYKFFCFDGEPKFLFVASDRQKKGEDVKFDFFDLDWNHLPVINGHQNSKESLRCPQNFNEMVDVSRKLSKGKRHVRVDLYNVNGKVFFGELTFFHFTGMTAFEPIKWDYIFGDYLHLPTDVIAKTEED